MRLDFSQSISMFRLILYKPRDEMLLENANNIYLYHHHCLVLYFRMDSVKISMCYSSYKFTVIDLQWDDVVVLLCHFCLKHREMTSTHEIISFPCRKLYISCYTTALHIHIDILYRLT